MSTPPQLRFFAVVLNWKRANDTDKTIASLQNAGLPDERIVVVDNETSTDQVALLKQSGAVVLPQPENLGYAGGNNAGIRYALENGAQAILVVNNDAEVAANVFPAWQAALQSTDKVGIVGAAVFDADTGELHNLGLDEGGSFVRDPAILQRDIAPAYAPHGCAMVLSGDMLREIGLLDERLFLMGEETDLAERARLAGWKILVAPRAMVFHEGGASFGGVSPLKVYYSHRNTLLKWTSSLERSGEAAAEKPKLRERFETSSQQLVVHWVRKREWAHAFAVASARRDALRGNWGKRNSGDGLGSAWFVARSVGVELLKRRRKRSE